MVRELRVKHQKILGRADQALLFTRIDTVGGAAEAGAASIAHLDEDQLFTSGHDEIELTTATAVIARHAVHAARDEKGFRTALPTLTGTRSWNGWSCFS